MLSNGKQPKLRLAVQKYRYSTLLQYFVHDSALIVEYLFKSSFNVIYSTYAHCLKWEQARHSSFLSQIPQVVQSEMYFQFYLLSLFEKHCNTLQLYIVSKYIQYIVL